VTDETAGIGAIRAISGPITFEIPEKWLMHPIGVAALGKVVVAEKK
jgi:hypothetical protein